MSSHRLAICQRNLPEMTTVMLAMPLMMTMTMMKLQAENRARVLHATWRAFS
ncbi:hypothetical protein M5D96_001304 [Drosophila gunungcola]|uniref:Uncharacterized protein n=1 Tax=Drosophila gunungcola TaxID=103775 RepID=A0A9Q0BV72_9MUSC|nr:hypothetical protein M5D96_001304 [Drosophila gunungcola]